MYASNTVVKRDYENCCPHGLLFINKALKCGEVRMPMTPFLESRARIRIQFTVDRQTSLSTRWETGGFIVYKAGLGWGTGDST